MDSPLAAGAEDAEPARLPDSRVLEIVGESLSRMTGQPWTVQPGPLLKGPGSAAVRIGAEHDGSFRHVDLEFLLSVGHPEQTSLINCGTGRMPDPEGAVRDAVESWRATTATVALEMLTRRGQFATHLGPGHSHGFPGWHAIVGEVVGWGFGEESRVKQEWFAAAHPWTELAPLLRDGLDRPQLNGIRLMLGQGGDSQTAEVRINGRLHAAAGAALAAMDWPRTEKMSVAHLFLLLVHPQVPRQTVDAAKAVDVDRHA